MSTLLRYFKLSQGQAKPAPPRVQTTVKRRVLTAAIPASVRKKPRAAPITVQSHVDPAPPEAEKPPVVEPPVEEPPVEEPPVEEPPVDEPPVEDTPQIEPLPVEEPHLQSPRPIDPSVLDAASIRRLDAEIADTILSRVNSFETRGSDTSVSSSYSGTGIAPASEASDSSSSSSSESTTSSGSEEEAPRPKVAQPTADTGERAIVVLERVIDEFRRMQRVYHEMCIEFIDCNLMQPAASPPPTLQSLCRRLTTVPLFPQGHPNFCRQVVLGTRVVWILCLPSLPSYRTVGYYLEGSVANQDAKELVVYAVGEGGAQETVDVSPNDLISDLSVFSESQIFCVAHLSATQTRATCSRARPLKMPKLDEVEALERYVEGTVPMSYLSLNKHKAIFNSVTEDGHDLAIRHMLAGSHGARINDHSSITLAAERLLTGNIPDTPLVLHPANSVAFTDAMVLKETTVDGQIKVCRKIVRFNYVDGEFKVYGKGSAAAEWTASNVVRSLHDTLLYMQGTGKCGVIFVSKPSCSIRDYSR
jgi:hypothetical protein